MESQNSIKKFRASNIIFGLLIIILAAMVFIFPETTLTFLIFIIAFAVLLMGIVRLINAFSDEKLSNFKVITRFITGIILMIFSMIVVFITLNDPAYSISVLIMLLAIALLILGIGRLFIGLIAKEFESWFRIVLITIGIITIIVSIVIFFIPEVGEIVLLVLLSINLLLNGIGRLILGIVGPESSK
ncbi:MAG: DUF308 domain-containing protein [Promethearchaeota archaeon]